MPTPAVPIQPPNVPTTPAAATLSPRPATIYDVQLRFNVTRQSRRGLDIIAPFEVSGTKGDEAQVGAFFKDSSGRILLARTNAPESFRTVEGQMATFAKFTLPLDRTIYRNNILFIPYDEFSLPAGRHLVNCWVEVHLKTNGVWRSVSASRELAFYVTMP
jgi:hypothetical protein